MKEYCVIARFDEKTEEVLSKWKQIAYSIQKSYYADKPWAPHMTIAAYEDIDETLLCNWVEEYSKSKAPLQIEFKSLGVHTHGQAFNTDVIYASPCVSLPLVDFYYGFHQKLDEYCGSFGFEYSIKCGYPVFHSTITVCDKNDFNSIFDYFRDNFISISGTIVALEVYEIPMRLIRRFELTKN